MRLIRYSVCFFLILFALQSYGQKTISEGTIVYDIDIQGKDKDGKNTGLNSAKNILYLKGGLSRTDMVSALGNETTIHNAKTGNAVILKEYSGQKLMITLNKNNWAVRNKKFGDIKFENTAETKVLQGYTCKQAVAKLEDGSTITVYYAPDLNLMNKDYNQAFKNLSGFPMEYEFETKKMKFKCTVSRIDLDPIASVKFDFPKSGYRVMTYDENKQGRKEE